MANELKGLNQWLRDNNGKKLQIKTTEKLRENRDNMDNRDNHRDSREYRDYRDRRNHPYR